ncbi:GOLPH3/VPS74 family protein [Streptomyces sp. NPDC002845]
MTTTTTLGEQILLLSLDDATGVARLRAQTEYAIAVAALLEEALSEGTGLPDDAERWIFKHRTEEYETARRGLLAKGLIREERRRVLRLFPATRYPERDGTTESALRDALTETVLHGRPPAPRLAALITLLHHGNLHTLAFPDADRATVKQRMSDIAETHWADPTLRRMADSVMAAVAALAVTTVVITTVT